MSGGLDVPVGFTVVTRGASTLIADIAALPDLQRRSLDRPSAWDELLRGSPAAEGRGSTARVELAEGRTVLVKRLRRGGIAGPLWKDRFLGTRRPIGNLLVPLEAARRGVPTPVPVALMVERSGAAWVRAWLAVEEIPDAADLAALFRSRRSPGPEELARVMRTVRAMHDRGVEHRDLNLGNLLLRRDRGSTPRAFVVDLDRARVHARSLSFRLRQRALRRLERSSCKLSVGGAGSTEVRDRYYDLYAGEDRELASRLQRGRASGRMLIRIHALGWRGRKFS